MRFERTGFGKKQKETKNAEGKKNKKKQKHLLKGGKKQIIQKDSLHVFSQPWQFWVPTSGKQNNRMQKAGILPKVSEDSLL